MNRTISEDLLVVSIKEHMACDLAGEVAILNLKNDTYYSLNPVAAFVWNLIGEPRRVADIRAALLDEYEVEPDRCLKDLVALISELHENGLVEFVAQ